jgi:hypothetical protein
LQGIQYGCQIVADMQADRQYNEVRFRVTLNLPLPKNARKVTSSLKQTEMTLRDIRGHLPGAARPSQ